MPSVTGGCACGAVRYECSADPILAANCYCRDCQHSTGTAMASVLLVPKAAPEAHRRAEAIRSYGR